MTRLSTEDVRFAALAVLADADEELPRRTVANRVFGTDLVGAGETYAALGFLTRRGWAEQCAYHPRNFRITAEGREQLEVQGALRGVA